MLEQDFKVQSDFRILFYFEYKPNFAEIFL